MMRNVIGRSRHRASRHPSARSGQSGQAAVESAIVLPLVVFLALGTLQLFMLLQGRILAEYAAYRAVRAGSLNHGNCVPMMHAAIASLLPAFARVDTPARLAAEFAQRKNNDYATTKLTDGVALSGDPVVWIWRRNLTPAAWGGGEDEAFDYSFTPRTLELELIFWYPLRIPFADWVITRMMLARYGMQTYSGGVIDPLSPAHQADWPDGWASGSTQSNMAAYANAQVVSRFQSSAMGGKYIFPIRATSAMRMMTPGKAVAWANCPNTP